MPDLPWWLDVGGLVIGTGLGVVGVVLGVAGWRIATRAGRFAFLQATSDLVRLRQHVRDSNSFMELVRAAPLDPGRSQPRLLDEFDTWEATMACHRAAVSANEARPEDRAAFLKELATFGLFLSQKSPRYAHVDHYLIAVSHVVGLPEMNEDAGVHLADTTARWIGARRASHPFDEEPRAYFARLQEGMNRFKSGERQRQPFDPLEFTAPWGLAGLDHRALRVA